MRKLVFPTVISTGVAIGAAAGYIAYDQNKPHSREGRVFSQSYHDFVQESVEQVFRDGSIRVDGVEYAINRTDNLKAGPFSDAMKYSDTYIGKKGNRAYDSLPMPLTVRRGGDTVTIFGWMDDDRRFLSVSGIVDRNWHTLRLIMGNTDISRKSFTTSVIDTPYQESSFDSPWLDMANQILPAQLSPWGSDFSNSAYRVKQFAYKNYIKSTTQDQYRAYMYDENIPMLTDKEQNDQSRTILQAVAQFEMMAADRSRNVLAGDNATGSSFQPMYQILGCVSVEDFVARFEAGEFPTSGELGVAFGMVLHAQIRKDIDHISTDWGDISQVLREDYGLKNQPTYTLQHVVESVQNRMSTVNQAGVFYPLNPVIAIPNAKIQRSVNSLLYVLGDTERIAVDGFLGVSTQQKIEDLQSRAPDYFLDGKINVSKVHRDYIQMILTKNEIPPPPSPEIAIATVRVLQKWLGDKREHLRDPHAKKSVDLLLGSIGKLVNIEEYARSGSFGSLQEESAQSEGGSFMHLYYNLLGEFNNLRNTSEGKQLFAKIHYQIAAVHATLLNRAAMPHIYAGRKVLKNESNTLARGYSNQSSSRIQ